jgi:hypothetical protein
MAVNKKKNARLAPATPSSAPPVTSTNLSGFSQVAEDATGRRKRRGLPYRRRG